MNRTLIYALLAFAFAGALTAQEPTSSQPIPTSPTQSAAGKYHQHRPDAQREAANLSRRLNLTQDQTAKVEPILANRDKKIFTLNSDPSITPDAKRTQMRSIRLDTRQQLANILTPEQMQKVQSMRHHRGGERGQAPPTPSGL